MIISEIIQMPKALISAYCAPDLDSRYLRSAIAAMKTENGRPMNKSDTISVVALNIMTSLSRGLRCAPVTIYKLKQ